MHLRKERTGYTFRRQYPIAKYTVDFYCPAKRLAIEVDGEQHFETLSEDKKRDEELARLGIRVIRIPSLDLFDEEHLALTSWLKIIQQALEADI